MVFPTPAQAIEHFCNCAMGKIQRWKKVETATKLILKAKSTIGTVDAATHAALGADAALDAADDATPALGFHKHLRTSTSTCASTSICATGRLALSATVRHAGGTISQQVGGSVAGAVGQEVASEARN